MAAPYFMLLTNDVDKVSGYAGIALSYCTIIGLAGIAYLFNDASDIEVDRKAGKENALSGMTKSQVAILGAFFTLLAIGPWFWFPVDRWSLTLLGGEILLFYLYAFRPFRLKERCWAGVITDAFYAHLIPAVLAAHTFNLIGGKHFLEISIFLAFLSVWQFFLGVRNILWHQLSDEKADRATRVKTLVTKIGADRTNRIRNWLVIPAEILSFFAFAWFINGFISWFLPAFGLFLLFTFLNKKETRHLTVSRITNNYLDDFYIRWYPVLVLSALMFTDIQFLPIVIAHLIIFRNGVVPIIKNVWKFILQYTDKLSFWPRQSKSNLENVSRNYKLAISSTNRNKYSETFIHAHYELLKRSDLLLCDGYLPSSVSIDKAKTFYQIQRIQISLFRKNPLTPSQALERLLRKNKTQVILAEYGPAGVELLPICQKLSIALIVHFHGYDAYRDDVLSSFGMRYPDLFNYASKLIVVSKHMRQQLIKLGAPPNKIDLLVYGIDTDFFRASAPRLKKKQLVFCGRFVAKKSPQNVIKAFKLICEKITAARLVMIGDGEELDACKALANELALENKIEFLGALPKEKVLVHFQQSSIYLQHSVHTEQNDSEGTPVSLLEAMSVELAVIATKHAGIVDVIEQNDNGLLVSEGDVTQMAQFAIDLLLDDQRTITIGKAARQTILQHHQKHKYLNELTGILNKIAI